MYVVLVVLGAILGFFLASILIGGNFINTFTAVYKEAYETAKKEVDQDPLYIRLPCEIGTQIYYIQFNSIFDSEGEIGTTTYDINLFNCWELGKDFWLTEKEAEEERIKMCIRKN